MAVYVRKPVRVEAFRFGVEPQPQWFIDMTNTGLAIEGMASFRCKRDARLLKLMHGDYIVRWDDLLWVCEGNKFLELYQLPDLEDVDDPMWRTQAVQAAFFIVASGAIICVAIGAFYGVGWGLVAVAVYSFVLGIYQWCNSRAWKKVADATKNSPKTE